MNYGEVFNDAPADCQCWRPVGFSGTGAGLTLDGGAGAGSPQPVPWWIPVLISVAVGFILQSEK